MIAEFSPGAKMLRLLWDRDTPPVPGKPIAGTPANFRTQCGTKLP